MPAKSVMYHLRTENEVRQRPRAGHLVVVAFVLSLAHSAGIANETEKYDRALQHLASVLYGHVLDRLKPSLDSRDLSDSEESDLIELAAARSATCRLDSIRYLGDDLFSKLIDSYANGEPASTQETLIEDALRVDPNLEAAHVELKQYIDACEDLVGQELGVDF